MKNLIDNPKLTINQAPTIKSSSNAAPSPVPSIKINLRASFKLVEGNTFEIIAKKSGIVLSGKKIPPKNNNIKNTIKEIGVALLVLLIRVARANPILKKHSEPNVSTSQKKK